MSRLDELLAKVRYAHGASAPVFLLCEVLARALADLSPDPQAKRAQDLHPDLHTVSTIPLHQLRRSCSKLSQQDVARALGSTQGAVSQLEHRAYMLVSSLRAYLDALGGELCSSG